MIALSIPGSVISRCKTSSYRLASLPSPSLILLNAMSGLVSPIPLDSICEGHEDKNEDNEEDEEDEDEDGDGDEDKDEIGDANLPGVTFDSIFTHSEALQSSQNRLAKWRRGRIPQ